MITGLIKKYYIFFLCVNIFLPKVNLGFGSFYVFEFVNIIIFGILLVHGRVLKNVVVQTYLWFIGLSYLAFLIGFIHYGFVDTNSLARLFKFTLFLLYIVIPFSLIDHLDYKDIKKVVNWQYIFFAVAGSYVVYNMIFHPQSLRVYMYGYDNRYRLIGLTGYAVDLSGSIGRLEGGTSVSMGVFIAFIFFIFLALYREHGRKKDLFIVCTLMLMELLVYSRAGLVVMVVGFLYHLLLNLRPATVVKIGLAMLVLLIGFVFFDLASLLVQSGAISKIFEKSLAEDERYRMLFVAADYISQHPFTVLWGNGFGDLYTYKATGYSHLEGLVPTTLFTSGVIAVFFLMVHMYFIWVMTRSETRRTKNEYTPFLYGMRLFVPGWVISLLIAGNTFQTDYYFPTIYFIFIGAYLLSRKTDPVTQATEIAA